MSTPASPDFLDGIVHFGEAWPRFAELAAAPAVDAATGAVDPASPAAAYQTALTADALRYLTLQLAASKASGHPGGFCSSAEAHAAFFLLGYKNVLTEVGHHAPGYYSTLFLDRSLEAMGIHTVKDLSARFRETGGLLGHLSGAIPGVLSPAGPLGQGQHFAMGAAWLFRDTLFPVTIGDGGMGEPYVMSALKHYIFAFPEITNYLPVLIWNGFSQEHHTYGCTATNEQMIAYWQAHGFQEIVLVDAKEFDDVGQEGPYVDSTKFSLDARLRFTAAVLAGVQRAADSALGKNGAGKPTVFIIKQIKGAGAHTYGSKSHHLYPQFTLEHADIVAGLQRRALSADAWRLVRENLAAAAGGPAGKVAVTESERPLAPLPELPLKDFPIGEAQTPSTAFGALVAAVGQADPDFVVANADGNEASGVRNISDALLIRHPHADPLYSQGPTGRVFEPISEDACAGLTAAVALLGGRSAWLSYESFAVNGLPVFQTVTQAMAELRRRTPAYVTMFTAGALEQGRNGWTHQRPEVEGYYGALARNGNVYPLFPFDANTIQACYAWALEQWNKGISIFAAKTPLPVRASLADARRAVEDGAIVLSETADGAGRKRVVLAAAGDLVMKSVFEAKDHLEQAGLAVRIVAVVNPRRLFRPSDVAWHESSEGDGKFLSDAEIDALFGGDALVCVTGGPGSTFEPLLVRATAPRRDLLCWKRGETAATVDAMLALNGLSADDIAAAAQRLL